MEDENQSRLTPLSEIHPEGEFTTEDAEVLEEPEEYLHRDSTGSHQSNRMH